METKNCEILMDEILNHPKTVLQELGADEALALVKRLSQCSPAAEKALKNCELVKLIESGTKFVTVKIITEEEPTHE